MKKIFNVLSVLILIGAVIGAVILVQKNQETRKGAAANETSSSILPGALTQAVGSTFTVHVYMDSGNDIDSMSATEFKIVYDATKIKYLGLIEKSDFIMLNTGEDANGVLTFKMVYMKPAKLLRAVNVVDVKFEALADGHVDLKTSSAKIQISGQPTMWDVATNNIMSLQIGGGTVNVCSKRAYYNTETKACAETANNYDVSGRDCAAPNDSCEANLQKFLPGKTSGSCYATLADCTAATSSNICSAKFYINTETNTCAQTANLYNSIGRDCSNLVKTCVGNLEQFLPGKTTKECFNDIASCQEKLSTGPANCAALTTESSCNTDACAWYTCANQGAGACFNRGTSNDVACPVDGQSLVLNYKLAFSNVNANNAKCVGDWPIKIKVVGGNQSKTYSDILPGTRNNVGDKLVFSGSLNLTGFTVNSGVAVFASGPKQLQMKYGIGDQAGYYGKAGGELTLTNSTTPVYDFSNYPMLAGDVVANDSLDNQDGVINGVDFAYVKSKSLVHETISEGGYLKGDLNGDCQVNSNDVNIMKMSLQERQGELY